MSCKSPISVWLKCQNCFHHLCNKARISLYQIFKILIHAFLLVFSLAYSSHLSNACNLSRAWLLESYQNQKVYLHHTNHEPSPLAVIHTRSDFKVLSLTLEVLHGLAPGSISW